MCLCSERIIRDGFLLKMRKTWRKAYIRDDRADVCCFVGGVFLEMVSLLLLVDLNALDLISIFGETTGENVYV